MLCGASALMLSRVKKCSEIYSDFSFIYQKCSEIYFWFHSAHMSWGRRGALTARMRFYLWDLKRRIQKLLLPSATELETVQDREEDKRCERGKNDHFTKAFLKKKKQERNGFTTSEMNCTSWTVCNTCKTEIIPKNHYNTWLSPKALPHNVILNISVILDIGFPNPNGSSSTESGIICYSKQPSKLPYNPVLMTLWNSSQDVVNKKRIRKICKWYEYHTVKCGTSMYSYPSLYELKFFSTKTAWKAKLHRTKIFYHRIPYHNFLLIPEPKNSSPKFKNWPKESTEWFLIMKMEHNDASGASKANPMTQ